VPKLNAAVPVLGALLAAAANDEATAARAQRSMLLLLGHKYPVVRRHAADQWYTRLVLAGDDDEELASLLISTPWDGEDTAAREGRDLICAHLGVEPPKRALRTRVREEATEFNYKDLVEEMGY
jgi:hypothetical protein